MQRARLLSAAVPVVDELGWSGVTVADVASRARVSRRTFYDLFADREECLLAVLQDTVARVERDLAQAGPEGVSWVERIRSGLWMILCFLDRDPVLARVCVVQSARGSRRVLQAREDLLARLASVVDGGRSQSARAALAPPLTAEGLVGAALAILYKRLLNGEQTPLSDLHGELLGMIVLPYLGAAAARRERKRQPPQHSEKAAAGIPRTSPAGREDPLRDVPMRLTYRTSRILGATAQHPGASNRVIGEHAGLTDQGQVSKLLARLQRLGLLTNTGDRQARGERNAWQLTLLGERVTHQLNLSETPQLHQETA
ncbi:MAG TPA: TetR family transcriptional regulator [Solirubrobacteraceae bacterium]|jgi:AcrR family transcriptional regulator/DNA-binding MarR family transcriptional regulator